MAWLAAPLAGQDGANDGFILFTTDRDNPSDEGMCDPPQCEDIYVMAPDGTNPVRLTSGGGAPTDSAAYNSGGADWSHSKKLIAFQSNRVDRVPQIHLMNLDGTEQQLLVSLAAQRQCGARDLNDFGVVGHGGGSPRHAVLWRVPGADPWRTCPNR